MGAALQSRLLRRTGASFTGAPTLTTTVNDTLSAAPAPSVAPLGVPEVRMLLLQLTATGVFYAGLFHDADVGRDHLQARPPRHASPRLSSSSPTSRLDDICNNWRHPFHRRETRALAGGGARAALLTLRALRGLQGGPPQNHTLALRESAPPELSGPKLPCATGLAMRMWGPCMQAPRVEGGQIGCRVAVW